jgi:hypothetical protein
MRLAEPHVVAEQAGQLVFPAGESPEFKDGYLTGQMTGDIRTEDANRTRCILGVSLKLRRNVLNSGITALSVPAKRPGNALTYWAELKKQ